VVHVIFGGKALCRAAIQIWKTTVRNSVADPRSSLYWFHQTCKRKENMYFKVFLDLDVKKIYFFSLSLYAACGATNLCKELVFNGQHKLADRQVY
jgi:hypothetical protein